MRKINIKTNNTLKFLQVFNGILELTDTELRVLANLIDLSETVNLCSPANKRKVAEIMEIKDHNTLNNYVKRLKDKKLLYKRLTAMPWLHCLKKSRCKSTLPHNDNIPSR